MCYVTWLRTGGWQEAEGAERLGIPVNPCLEGAAGRAGAALHGPASVGGLVVPGVQTWSAGGGLAGAGVSPWGSAAWRVAGGL